MNYLKSDWPLLLIFTAVLIVIAKDVEKDNATVDMRSATANSVKEAAYWHAPSLFTDNIDTGKKRALLVYGEELVTNTSRYFGPRGSLAQISNGMNCQNCHLDAGTRPWGNNYGATGSTYPKFRARSGRVEGIAKRVNDCFERSLNGSGIDSNSTEMNAIVTYIEWLDKDVPKGVKPKGTGMPAISWINRAADPATGAMLYQSKCVSCHGKNGDGVARTDGFGYVYPPLWGDHSFNDGAGIYRLSSFAAFIKSNMPYNQSTYQNPQLSDEEAWDIAAFVNSKPRPVKNQSGDWPDIKAKPVDFPAGPYADGFTVQEHKYGPYQKILAFSKQKKP